MIIVKPINQKFGIVIEKNESKLLFTFQQLDYKTKSEIASQTITMLQGSINQDSTLACFLNIKYGLKDVKGLSMPDGTDYKLKFEDNSKKCLTDDCTDELLATELHDDLVYTARDLINGIPDKILHPITNKPLEGVSVVPPEKYGELSKNL